MIDNLLAESVPGLRMLMRSGELTATELVQTSLDAINSGDGVIGAFTEVLDDRAMREACAITANDARPFAGIPIAVKENTGVAGALTTYGSVSLAGHRSAADQSAVARLRAAGAIVVGMTSMSEFGLLPGCEPIAHGPTNNPVLPGFSTGGSSGGSAAAVAAGFVPLALGNDGGGSLRIPAAWCGLATVVRCSAPSSGAAAGYARTSTDGVLTRSIGDAWLGQQALDGHAQWTPAGEGRRRIRVIVVSSPPRSDPANLFDHEAVTQVADRLADLGIEVSQRDPDWTNPAVRSFFPAVAPAMRQNILRLIAASVSATDTALEVYTRSFLDHAGRVPLERHLRAVDDLARWSYSLTKWIGPDAVLISPTSTAPVRLGRITGAHRIEDAGAALAGPTSFTWLASSIGWWAAAVPMHPGARGPRSVQLMAPPMNVAALQEVCHWLSESSLSESEARGHG